MNNTVIFIFFDIFIFVVAVIKAEVKIWTIETQEVYMYNLFSLKQLGIWRHETDGEKLHYFASHSDSAQAASAAAVTNDVIACDASKASQWELFPATQRALDQAWHWRQQQQGQAE